MLSGGEGGPVASRHPDTPPLLHRLRGVLEDVEERLSEDQDGHLRDPLPQWVRWPGWHCTARRLGGLTAGVGRPPSCPGHRAVEGQDTRPQPSLGYLGDSWGGGPYKGSDSARGALPHQNECLLLLRAAPLASPVSNAWGGSVSRWRNLPTAATVTPSGPEVVGWGKRESVRIDPPPDLVRSLEKARRGERLSLRTTPSSPLPRPLRTGLCWPAQATDPRTNQQRVSGPPPR